VRAFNPEQALARYFELEERRDAEFRHLPDFERRVARGDYEFFSSGDNELRELEQEAQWNAFDLEGKGDGQHLVYTIEQMSPEEHAAFLAEEQMMRQEEKLP
jgi:hypothetical protein